MKQIAIALWLVAACASGPPPYSPTLGAAFKTEQHACIENNDTGATIDACRNASKTRWCAQYPDVAPDCPLKPSDRGQVK